MYEHREPPISYEIQCYLLYVMVQCTVGVTRWLQDLVDGGFGYFVYKIMCIYYSILICI